MSEPTNNPNAPWPPVSEHDMHERIRLHWAVKKAMEDEWTADLDDALQHNQAFDRSVNVGCDTKILQDAPDCPRCVLFRTLFDSQAATIEAQAETIRHQSNLDPDAFFRYLADAKLAESEQKYRGASGALALAIIMALGGWAAAAALFVVSKFHLVRDVRW